MIILILDINICDFFLKQISFKPITNPKIIQLQNGYNKKKDRLQNDYNQQQAID
jgi:hypothetical protein